MQVRLDTGGTSGLQKRMYQFLFRNKKNVG